MAETLEHTCARCQFKWSSRTLKDFRNVQTAAKVNHGGPVCILCYHLEMADRYARARGMGGLVFAANRFVHALTPRQRKRLGK